MSPEDTVAEGAALVEVEAKGEAREAVSCARIEQLCVVARHVGSLCHNRPHRVAILAIERGMGVGGP